MPLPIVDITGVLAGLPDDPAFSDWGDRWAVTCMIDELCDESFDHGTEALRPTMGLPKIVLSFAGDTGLIAITYQICKRSVYGDNAGLYVLDVSFVD